MKLIVNNNNLTDLQRRNISELLDLAKKYPTSIHIDAGNNHIYRYCGDWLSTTIIDPESSGLDTMEHDPIFGLPMTPWIKCFAFMPHITVDHGLVWLQFIWKRRVKEFDNQARTPKRWWQYRSFYKETVGKDNA